MVQSSGCPKTKKVSGAVNPEWPSDAPGWPQMHLFGV
jgi:hypothetical protein